jgi:hypothetical protein
VQNTQARTVSKASYWYLRLSQDLEEKTLPDLEEAHEQVLQVAKQIKTARKLESFKCPQGESGCWACRPLEMVINGQAELVGTNAYRQDIYILQKNDQTDPDAPTSVIL